jgi:hypothetical protein
MHCSTGEVFVQQPNARDVLEWDPLTETAIVHKINGHILQIHSSKNGTLIALQPFINKDRLDRTVAIYHVPSKSRDILKQPDQRAFFSHNFAFNSTGDRFAYMVHFNADPKRHEIVVYDISQKTTKILKQENVTFSSEVGALRFIDSRKFEVALMQPDEDGSQLKHAIFKID